MSLRKPAPWLLLLDRDGTLMEDVGYPNDPAKVKLLPGAAEGVKALVQAGFVPAVVSNQSGVDRGLITIEQLEAVDAQFVSDFERASGIRLKCYYCIHGVNDRCSCRKPKPGLLLHAAAQLGLTGRHGFMIGDKPSDVAAGQAAGLETVWLSFDREYPANEPRPTLIGNHWSAVTAALKLRIATMGAAS